MTNDVASYTAADLSDPTISAPTLSQIAAARPDLWPEIIRHPNSYAGLNEWIRQQEHATPFDSGVATGTGAQGPAPTGTPSAARTPGVEEIAAGAKNFFNDLQNSARAQISQGGDVPIWSKWAPLAIPGAALLAIISLFFPVMSLGAYGRILGGSPNYFVSPVGILFLFGMLAVIAFAAVSLATKQNWARITAAAVGMGFALLMIFSSLGAMAQTANLPGVSVGPSPILLLISSLVLAAAAVLTLVPARTAAA